MKRSTRPELWFSLCLLLTAVANSAAQAPRGQQQPEQAAVKLPAFLIAEPVKEDPKDADLRKLLKARYNEALAEVKGFYEDVSRPGRDRLYSQDDLYGPWQRLVQAGLELFDKPAERVALLTQYVEMTKDAEKDTQASHDAGRVGITALHRARYQRLDAEIRLLRAEREAADAKDK